MRCPRTNRRALKSELAALKSELAAIRRGGLTPGDESASADEKTVVRETDFRANPGDRESVAGQKSGVIPPEPGVGTDVATILNGGFPTRAGKLEAHSLKEAKEILLSLEKW